MHEAIGACKFNFDGLSSCEARDDRSVAQRLSDVLSESHREDTSSDFRLGLLQGALAIALPDLLAEDKQDVSIRIDGASFSKHLDTVVADLSKNNPKRQVRRATPAQRAKPKARTAAPRSKRARGHA